MCNSPSAITNAILVVAEFSADFSEHFLPIVDEIRKQYVGVKVNAILHRVKLTNWADCYAASESFPFDNLVITEGKDQLSAALSSKSSESVFIFFKHNFAPGDLELYRVVPSVIPYAVYLLRNTLKLRDFLQSGKDNAGEISRLSRRYARRELEIAFKVRIVYIVALVFQTLLGILVYFRKGSDRHRILFIRLDVLGDMVLTLPTLLAIREKYPESEITVLASRRSGSIIEEQHRVQPARFCDRLQYWQAPWHEQKVQLQGFKAFFRILQRVLQLRLERYDIIIQPVELGTGVLFATLLKGKVTVATIAERLPLARLMVHHVQSVVIPTYMMYHIADLPAFMAEELSCKNVRSYLHKSLLVSKADKLAVFQTLTAHKWNPHSIVVTINIGAGSPKRRWSPHKYAGLVSALTEIKDIFPVIVGGEGERELGETINALIDRPLPNLVGTLNLNQLVSLLSISDLVVTPDTGVMHIAAALDRKIVALYGAGLVSFCRPLCSEYLIVKAELGCSGCGDLCFVDGEPPCISAITVEMVLDAVHSLLK
ncbi:glycosyltransferase family 9 protein [Geobacter sp. AOG2]|uniref:glycosyltransferase family 9 protein n=1 Tax=Geobacter sp. AOG2 TaxID=1566347 RepID=UPI001CC3A5BA|nr:glycosyltransferase family 9 protein [Geobacter sp. AOG2]GFE61332.1 hypothetical protein AOG2_19190 [Geobacter sp. AOG2]